MRLDVETVQDVELLRQVIRLQEAEITRLHKRLAELVRRQAQAEGKSESAALQLELIKLSEQLATLQHRMYGPSSEKRPYDKPQPAQKPPQKGHGPTPQPELPHTEQRHELSESERTCPRCQLTLAVWPGQTEDSEEISVVQRRFVLVTHKRQKYRCACNAAILTAPGPLKLIESGRYSLDFAIEVAVQKYAEHLPLERQVHQMRRQGLVVTSPDPVGSAVRSCAGAAADVSRALAARTVCPGGARRRDRRGSCWRGRRVRRGTSWGISSEYGNVLSPGSRPRKRRADAAAQRTTGER